MKSWSPAVYVPDPRPGDTLGPTLPEASRLELQPPSCNSEPLVATETKERKNHAKKKCLYNFQDAFMEANRVVMATSSATSSVCCTATTVQSSDVFHSVEDHRRAPPFPKNGATATGFMDARPGLCPSPADLLAPPPEGGVSAPPSVCSDPECEGHHCDGRGGGGYDHQPYDGEDSQDDDSCSEHSSSTSTSTNQKEGKFCDCCYCEFFGHGGVGRVSFSRSPTPAPPVP
ncbi:hypothetical protein ANANG_G00133790 [Anguilla anguilla]|uniref:FAM193 C-terminal domain-containing protein n=1 Tax=Anguilla anguilla TaxID=7936 RepID=A0A9D3MCH8_ANGAN|nr:hypothetical protein ANANG_G00133790 [Anguilla anguilla]